MSEEGGHDDQCQCQCQYQCQHRHPSPPPPLPPPPPPPKSKLTRLYEEGKGAMSKNDYGKAIKLFTKALKAYDTNFEGPNDMAVIFCARSAAFWHSCKYEESLKDAIKAIDNRPDWSKGYFRKAEALIGQGKRDEAIASYLTAEQLEKDCRSLDIISLRMLRLKKEDEAGAAGIYFKQLCPGRDICLGTFNPIKRVIFEFARRMQNIIYLIGDARSKECIIVDACWDSKGIVSIISKDKMRPVGCIITHNHFDHVGGKPPVPFRNYGISVEGVKNILEKFPEIPVYIHKDDADAFQNDSNIDPNRIRTTIDGMEINLGGGMISMKFLHTPGHTPGSQCILINGKMLLTGDTLFPNSCGRMDLPGGCPIAMFETLQNRLANLTPSITIYPGHSYGNHLVTSISREKSLGVLYKTTLQEWLQKLGNPVTEGNDHCCSHHNPPIQ